MCRNTRRIVLIAVFITVLLAGLLGVVRSNEKILGNLIFGDRPTKIKDGFSVELKEKLGQRYGLYIPDMAKFTDGCYTNGFRDAYIVITFEIDISEIICEAEDLIEYDERKDGSVVQVIRSMLLVEEKWGRDSSAAAHESTIAEVDDLLNTDVGYDRMFACLDVDRTYLFYNFSNAGTVQFCFVGWRPLR